MKPLMVLSLLVSMFILEFAIVTAESNMVGEGILDEVMPYEYARVVSNSLSVGAGFRLSRGLSAALGSSHQLTRGHAGRPAWGPVPRPILRRSPVNCKQLRCLIAPSLKWLNSKCFV